MVERVTSRHDTELRFHNTLVQYNGEYYYATLTGDETHRVHLRNPLLTEEVIHQNVDPNSDAFEANSFQLGYLNWEQGTCYYIERMPFRQQKQGLTRSALTACRAGSITNEGCGSSLFFSRGFISMLKGEYPSVTDAVKLVLSSKSIATKGLAVSRDFAIKRYESDDPLERKLQLYYKQRVIGNIDEKLQAVLLEDTYNHSIFRQRLNKLGFIVG